MTDGVRLRLLQTTDAAEIASLTRRNRSFVAPYDPVRAPEYYTEPGQARRLTALLRQYEEGVCIPFGIIADDAIVGTLNLNNIVRGSFESASLGYFVDEAHGGRGIATAAVAAACTHAFDKIGLHRLEAGTLVDNVRSQRVLASNGFTQYGLAPDYLRIAGRWQDHVLFQRLSPAR